MNQASLALASLLAAAALALGAWFAPVRADIESRPAPRVDATGQPLTAQPLSSLSEEDRKAAEELRVRVDALEATFDRHSEEMSAGWNSLLSDVTRENARREVEGRRIAGVVDAAGGQGVEGQVEDLMDEVSRKRVKGVIKGWLEGESGLLKAHLQLSGTQATAFDQAVAEILAEINTKVDTTETDDNLMGWRSDLMKEARTGLQQRLDVMLTGEQKMKAEQWWKSNDWGRAFTGNREANK
jgi:hypothetical protein